MQSTKPVAVVTGATGGLGSAIAVSLAGAGFRIVVGYRQSAASAETVIAGLPGGGHKALHLPVTDSARLQQGAGQVAADFHRCDVLINCAGTTRFVPHGDLQLLDDALIDEILATNVRGSFAALRAFHPQLKQSPLPGGGVVINVSSIAARTAIGSNVMYCASKAAVDSMTLSLARSLAPAVRVLSVSPGLVATEFVKSLDPRWRDEQIARTPLGRLAEPEDVAQSVLVAIRDLTFATGCVIPVDGGRPLN